MPTERLPGRTGRYRAVVYSLVVFIAGGLTGAVLMNLYEHFFRHPAGHVITPSSWRSSDREHYIEKLRGDLQLNEVQARELETILDETMRQYYDLHAYSHHIRQEGIERIRAMLDDGQRKRFERLIREKKEAPLEDPRGAKPR